MTTQRWTGSYAISVNPKVKLNRIVVGMLLRIALVLFTIEALIMLAFAGWTLNANVIHEGILDATLLTLFSTPVIYQWIVKPFVVSTQAAQTALSEELRAKESQADALGEALNQKSELLQLNEDLRRGLQRANVLAATANENALQRIGADLHDGPAQLLAYAVMRFDGLAKWMLGLNVPDKRQQDLTGIQRALGETLREVRHISAGLAPPIVESAKLSETLSYVVAAHEEHTGTGVARHFDRIPDLSDTLLKVCVYRFVQEALNNAYQHAGGRSQEVRCFVMDREMNSFLTVQVSDAGPGFCPVQGVQKGLGLAGMRSRIEAIGGTLSIESDTSKGGATLTAAFVLPAAA